MLVYIKVGSVTNAQRASSALRESGINAVIKRIENPQSGDGCGYVIGVDEKRLLKAKNILKGRGIKVLGVHGDDLS